MKWLIEHGYDKRLFRLLIALWIVTMILAVLVPR